MTAPTLSRADQDRPLVADAPLVAPASSGDVLPETNVQCWDDVHLLPWEDVAAPIDFVLLDADLLFTRPPDGAECLADVVLRVAG